jgi:hypothetical protein
MGLDTSHDCWHGSYSSFNDFRARIAADQGIDDLRQFYKDHPSMDTKPYEEAGVDPRIIPLLNHSDCDGELSPIECREIALFLNEYMQRIEGKDLGAKWHREEVNQFSTGAMKAWMQNEHVEFR